MLLFYLNLFVCMFVWVWLIISFFGGGEEGGENQYYSIKKSGTGNSIEKRHLLMRYQLLIQWDKFFVFNLKCGCVYAYICMCVCCAYARVGC